MPRYNDDLNAAGVPVSQEKRKFPKPWTYQPAPNGYAVYDANGVRLFAVTFTAQEMREHFPDGLTHDEAAQLARFVTEVVNRVEPKPAPVQNGQVQGSLRQHTGAKFHRKPGQRRYG